MVSFGLDGMAFLKSTDPLERLLMQEISNEVQDIERERDTGRAQLIAREVAKVFGGR
jgi:hypothetical protein